MSAGDSPAGAAAGGLAVLQRRGGLVLSCGGDDVGRQGRGGRGDSPEELEITGWFIPPFSSEGALGTWASLTLESVCSLSAL